MAYAYGYPLHYTAFKLTVPQVAGMLALAKERNQSPEKSAPAASGKDDDEDVPSLSALTRAFSV